MTVLHPCLHCHRKSDCQIKIDTLAGLKGLRISKANLRCKIPRQDFPIGASVTVQAFELFDCGYSDAESYRKSAITRRGVVSAWKGNKATVVLDKDEEIETPDGNIAHLHAEPDRLARIDAPLVEMCSCGGLSKARCEANDHPSLRNDGAWYCKTADEARMEDQANKEGWF